MNPFHGKTFKNAVVFMFPGLGDIYTDMGRELYTQQPFFHSQVDHCATILKKLLNEDIRDILYPKPQTGTTSPKEKAIDFKELVNPRIDTGEENIPLPLTRPIYSHTALFTIEYAMTRLLIEWGILPIGLIGHSLGEFTAACFSGVFSLKDALTLIVKRAQLIEALPKGKMLAVQLNEKELKGLLNRFRPSLGISDQEICLSIVNSPSLCVLSGTDEAIDAMESVLSGEGITTRPVRNSHPLHSPLMLPICDSLTRVAEKMELHPPDIPFISNTTGTWITSAQATDPTYWGWQATQTVRLADGMKNILDSQSVVMVEAGPGQTLGLLALENAKHQKLPKPQVVASMRHAYDRRMNDMEFLSAAVENLQAGDPAPPPNTTQSIKKGHLEETVSSIWRELLGVETVNTEDHFFAIGGHSLQAMQFIFKVNKRLGIELPIHFFFENPTIEGLIPRIKELMQPGNKNKIPQLVKTTEPGPYKLSFAQERFWFLDQLDPGNPAYNVPIVCPIEGEPNIEVLRQSLDAIVQRHTILRTVYELSDHQPVQRVVNDLPCRFKTVDLSDPGKSPDSFRKNTLICKEIRLPFNLETGPPLRAVMIKEAPRQFTLLLIIHHIAFDGWSKGLLLKELLIFYRECLKGTPVPVSVEADLRELPVLPVQYHDYVIWHRQIAQTRAPEMERQLEYWQKKLKGMNPQLELPYFRPRPPKQTFNGSQYRAYIPAPITDKLKNISKENKKTLFTTLLSAFIILLHRCSGMNDFGIGTPVSGRDVSLTKDLIGLFVNTVVLRTPLTGDLTFRKLLSHVSRTVSEAFAHRDIPFEKLVEEIAPIRDISSNPLFQVMFLLHIDSTAPIEFPGFVLLREDVDTGLSRFDLTLGVRETKNSLLAIFEYNTDLFEPETIQAMGRHFLTLVKGITDNPEAPIALLPLLTEQEQRELLEQWNNKTVDYPLDTDVPRLFAEQVSKGRDRIAATGVTVSPGTTKGARKKSVESVLTGFGSVSYKRLNERADQLAERLREAGVTKGTIVGIMMNRSIDLPAGILAIWKAGGAFLPIDPEYPGERIQYMLQDSQASVLLTSRQLNTGPGFHVVKKTVFIEDGEKTVRKNAPQVTGIASPADPVDPNSPAYIMYTSGSTGKPKGVLITIGNLMNYLYAMREIVGLKAVDIWAAVSTICFDISVGEICLPLITGGATVVVGRRIGLDGHRLARLLSMLGVTIMQATPITWRILLESGWQPEKNFTVLSGGETLSPDLAGNLLAQGASLFNLYGPTETTIWSTYHRVGAGEPEKSLIPIGKPLANTDVYVLDSHMQPVPCGASGELYIGGYGLAPGYINNPGETARCFIQHPFNRQPGARLYKTGDRVRRMTKGTLQFLGRMDSQVKVRGFRIELEEIETLLNQHPIVINNAVAVQQFDRQKGDSRLIAYVVSKTPAKPGPSRKITNLLGNYLGTRLPYYMIPSIFIVMEALPLTPNGKIDRDALPHVETATFHMENTYVPPTDDLEHRMVSVWQKVLKVRPIGIKDDFFKMGGYSLTAIRLFALIEGEFGRQLPVAEIFNAPTVEKLTAAVKKDAFIARWSPMVTISSQGVGSPLFLMHHLDGGIIDYQELAQRMGKQRPIFGLQAPAPIDGATHIPMHKVKEIAVNYVEEICTFKPRGPYIIGGHSFGGRVAFEVACRLQEMGKDVPLLVLIDTRAPGCRFLPMKKRIGFSFFSYIEKIKFHTWRLFSIPLKQKGHYLGAKFNVLLKRAKRQSKSITKKLLRKTGLRSWRAAENQGKHLTPPERGDTNKTTGTAPAARYVPGQFTGRTVLFKSAVPLPVEDKEKYGWEKYISGSLEVHEIPGEHGNITKDPHVRVLAKILNDLLEAL